ncbi:MAG: CCA tRNA nucleotidyltransferase [Phycisphaerae bacterium]
MSESFPFQGELPRAADAAVRIVRKLTAAGYQALLAGGCVRDLLLGLQPQDYDVATDATPERICQLFRKTREVGAQFGVVLVCRQRRWVEVATFRSDGRYLDGRRPSEVTFSDARHDAERRDFTVNGMFLDPLSNTLIDYVGGQKDLRTGVIRAIGEPAARFAEDHLRLVRAVRFAGRLGFEIEPATFVALKANARKLETVAAERVREELEKMLTHPARRRAFDLLVDSGLLPHLWPDAAWQAEQIAAGGALLERLPQRVSFPLVFAVLVADRGTTEVQEICRALTCSNEQCGTITWLIEHQGDLDDPGQISLAGLKRLLAHPAFPDLRAWAEARYLDMPNERRRREVLAQRVSAIAPDEIQPLPLVTGDDLAARGVKPGPIYKDVLDRLYTRQLEETLATRVEALQALEELLANTPRERR